jgi:hypothetical protein
MGDVQQMPSFPPKTFLAFGSFATPLVEAIRIIPRLDWCSPGVPPEPALLGGV